MGEEDVLDSKKTYSGTLKCYSTKGTVFELPEEIFKKLEQLEEVWKAVEQKIKQKQDKVLNAAYLSNSPPKSLQNENEKKLEAL